MSIQRERAPFTLRGQVSPDHEVWGSWGTLELDLDVAVVGAEFDEGV